MSNSEEKYIGRFGCGFFVGFLFGIFFVFLAVMI